MLMVAGTRPRQFRPTTASSGSLACAAISGESWAPDYARRTRWLDEPIRAGRRSLALLVDRPEERCTEALMLAHGFTAGATGRACARRTRHRHVRAHPRRARAL